MPLDHGLLNLPLAKRGITDREIDAWKNDQRRQDQESGRQFKADRAEARRLFDLHAEGLADRTATKCGVSKREALKHLDRLAKWEPGKAIALLTPKV